MAGAARKAARQKKAEAADAAPLSRALDQPAEAASANVDVAPAAHAKRLGAYYTPPAVVSTLVRWAVHQPSDRMLDPSCGDGRFLAAHPNSVGIEQDAKAAHEAMERAPGSLVHEGDFFAWAAHTAERFECAAGNPPFIRYQTFKGEVREQAIALCARLGAKFSGLSSSWAPFLVATASLLKPGGRLAFVVPAEIGHAPYSAPLLEYLVAHFASVHVVAFREKLFPQLSEDCWLLYADGFGGSASEIRFSAQTRFHAMSEPPRSFSAVPTSDWRSVWQRRLRPFLLSAAARGLYAAAINAPGTRRMSDVASVGIGYVTGDNDFFHLRPSVARRLKITSRFLLPSVRNGKALPARTLTDAVVARWRAADEQMLLLRLPKSGNLPTEVRGYLDSEDGKEARKAYKCRMREPWYSVPDVQVPDLFLSYMSGLEPSLVQNVAGCTCTNSVHSVRLKEGVSASRLLSLWNSAFVKLSCEIEGHPLGGGMLKLEPGEAARVVLPEAATLTGLSADTIEDALATMRTWRHYGA